MRISHCEEELPMSGSGDTEGVFISLSVLLRPEWNVASPSGEEDDVVRKRRALDFSGFP